MELESKVFSKTIWRGNRKSSFAQSYHADERECASEAGNMVQCHGASSETPLRRRTPAESATKSGLDLHALVELKHAFDESTNGELDKEEFMKVCNCIKELAEELSEADMDQFYMKIDVNDKGTVNWDDFSSFILLQQLANEGQLGANFATYVKANPSGRKPSSQTDVESDSDLSEDEDVPTHEKLVQTCLRAASVTVERPTNAIEQIIHLEAIQTYVTATQDGMLKLWHADTLKLLRTQKNGNGAWISDIVAMAQQPLAAFAMDRSITFYDTGRLSFEMLGRIEHLKNVPLCGTWLRTTENDKLLYGDDHGYLHTYDFSDEWGGDNSQVASAITHELLPGMTEKEPWKIHSGWVTKIKYLAHSSSLLSGSMDNSLTMLDLSKQQKKWSAKEHKHGIFAIDYCRTFNFIVTCGLEHYINIWNPFTAKTMGVLHGHQSPVLILLTGGSCFEAWQKKLASEIRSSKICAVVFSGIFRQVVVGEVDSIVRIWSIDSGEQIFAFSDTHRGAKFSAMHLDGSGRRLLVGGQDGSLRMWNFNNGQCLKEFQGFGKNEITCILCLTEGRSKHVVAAGWHGKVCIWEDGLKEQEVVEHVLQGHLDDVICMTFCPPDCLATAGYDDKVIVWKLDGMIKCILRLPEIESKGRHPRVVMDLVLLFHAEKILAGSAAHGYIYFWSISDSKLIYEHHACHIAGLGPMCIDSKNKL